MKTFSKATLAALFATVVDFGTLTLMVQGFHIYYPIGVATGACLGALANFTVNRYWSFEAARYPVGRQMLRYALVSFGSLVLNTVGVYAITEKFGIFYLESKIIIAIGIGVFFNYPLHKHFVYRLDRRAERRSKTGQGTSV